MYMRALEVDYKQQVEELKEKQRKETEKHNLESETLRAYILDIKGRFPDYVPMRKDEIDLKLAEYINNYPDKQKLKLMFIRKSEGIYDFGTRSLMLKIMRGHI